jgi:hypothetical protein
VSIRADLTIPQGKAWTSDLFALIGEDGAPMDLAGKTIRAQVRSSERDVDVLHEWSTARGNIHVTTVQVALDDGTELTCPAIAFTVRPSESSAWRWTLGVYDCEVSTDGDPDSTLGLIDPSAVSVEGEVTR